MKALVTTVLFLFHIQLAWADCADLNRQAIPNKTALQAATEEYKSSVASHLRDTLNDSPPINVISEGVAATTKMITAMDKSIDYLRSVLNARCFGKDTNGWSAAIAQMESQRDGMRNDRKTYIDMLSIMAKGEEKSRKYLTGPSREDFIKGTANGCMHAKINDEEAKIIPNSLFEGHCRCYANTLADKITIADMQSDNKAVTDPIVKAAALTCYQAMKAEALRLYNAGQYPKQ